MSAVVGESGLPFDTRIISRIIYGYAYGELIGKFRRAAPGILNRALILTYSPSDYWPLAMHPFRHTKLP